MLVAYMSVCECVCVCVCARVRVCQGVYVLYSLLDLIIS
jgi:hypothetical protein